MSKVIPLGKRVLVKRSEAKTTKGGIFLPETAKEKPKQGEVVAVGPELELKLNVGDQVLFAAYSGTEVKTEEQGVEYLIMAEDDILCVLL